QRDHAEIGGLEFGGDSAAPVHVRAEAGAVVVVELNREGELASDRRLRANFTERNPEQINAAAFFGDDLQFVDGRVAHQMPAAQTAGVLGGTENCVLPASAAGFLLRDVELERF